jgi:hypothetical protein
VTDFLNELELQMTAAAQRAAAERARPPRVKRWPTVAVLAVAAVAVVAMVLMPARQRDAAPAKPPFVSLKDTTIGIFNAGGVPGLASAAEPAIRRLGPRAAVDTARSEARYSVVLADHGHAAQARRVARALGIERFGAPRELRDPRTGRRYDIAVLLGKDFAAPAPRLLSSFAFLRESLNRWVQTPAGVIRVIAARTGLCLQLRDGDGWSGPCFDVHDALKGKAILAHRARAGRVRGAAGLVPDGIAAVERPRTRRLPVGRNLWAIGAESVTTVSFDGTTLDVP